MNPDELRKMLGGDPMAVKKPGGHVIIDGQEVAQTLQCGHCHAQWIVVRGSGRRRGFCMGCNKPTCGNQACMACIPREAKLEFQDGGNTNPRKHLKIIKKLMDQYPGIERSI